MISSEEVKLAMAFDKNYVVLGTEKDKVKQCGNAVTPPAMEWLVERVAESLDAA
jgi:DNA (cytosine-5)-methyltransferase 1